MATSVDWVIIGVIVADVLVTGSATLSITVVDTTASAAVDAAAADDSVAAWLLAASGVSMYLLNISFLNPGLGRGFNSLSLSCKIPSISVDWGQVVNLRLGDAFFEPSRRLQLLACTRKAKRSLFPFCTTTATTNKGERG
jgi:hypothetical protein